MRAHLLTDYVRVSQSSKLPEKFNANQRAASSGLLFGRFHMRG